MINKHLTADLKEYIQAHIQLLPSQNSSSISPLEADERASQLLIAKAYLAEVRLSHMTDLSRETTIATCKYNEVMNNSLGKVTEKKAGAEASPEYTQARESLEDRDNFVKYLNALIDIFQDGHIQLRQMKNRMM